ncbi:MAG: DUF255 domain-containing protein, partial [Polyangiaceae bacterium]
MMPSGARAFAFIVFAVAVAIVPVGCVQRRMPIAVGSVPDAAAGARQRSGSVVWADLDAAAFARARAEHRLVLIDGSAEWCHFCHVMDAVTYSDPEVRRILAASFVTVRVDIDARPDFEERYHEWGWPATVLMTAEGAEIARYKGFQPPAKFVELLRAAVATPTPSPLASPTPATKASDDLASIASWTEQTLDALWDARQGGWGGPQKLPLAWDNAWMLYRARAVGPGRDEARRRVLFTLDQQRKIVDPVWGGLCQYSTDGDWLHPHFEKLISYQAGAIDNYAAAFALTGDAGWLKTARHVRSFVDRFMTSPDGAFYATMDADLNAHDPGRPFLSGHEYYAKSDAARRALGIPRIDRHEYPRENGLVIAAYVTLGEASRDPSVIASAARAASRILATHATSRGGLTHTAGGDPRVLYLADNAAFGLSLARLYEATGDRAYLDAAKR